MEEENQWRQLNQASIPVFGASCARVGDSVYLIGGMMAGNSPESVLQIRKFDLETMNWSPITVNANNAVNRAYHASTSVDDTLLIVGGVMTSRSSGEEKFLPEIITCTPHSLEGLKCVTSYSSNAELKGHSVKTMGAGDLIRRIIIFGGSSSKGTCESNDLLVYVGDSEDEVKDEDILKPVSCTGPAPDPRSHHACAVAGRRQEYLIVCAGWNGAVAYDDLWVCDLTNLLSGRSLEPEEPPPPTKGKKKDEIPIPELYTWHQIHISEPFESRFMHGCWAACPATLDDGLKIGIFGGMSAFGPISYEATIQYAVEYDGQECNAHLEYAPQTERECNLNSRYGFSTETIYENGQPTLIFVFGGKHDNCDSHCCVLDSNTDIAKRLASCLPLPCEEEDAIESNIKTIHYPNGDEYEGEVFVDVDDGEKEKSAAMEDIALIRHGHGVMKYADGGIYEGQWEYNNQQGPGKYITADQETIYDGNFNENEFHGQGQLSLRNGSTVYNGNFEKGKYQGSGVLLDNDKHTIYEGDFSQGMKNGKGVLREANTDSEEPEQLGPLIYDGSWKDDKPCGSGTLILPGGHVYTGDIVDSRPEGKGVCKYADGGEYSGSWRAGRRNGTGEYISRTLDEYKGKWVGDVRSGKGQWISRRGDSYHGLWDANYPHGQGIMTYRVKDDESDGSREKSYSGEWNHGKRHGFGEVVYVDGKVKKGSWKTNKYDDALVDYDAGQ